MISHDGTVLFTSQDIKGGQNVWQSMGGQEVGTVWGHGAFKAPDWTADWLHREAMYMLNKYSVDKTIISQAPVTFTYLNFNSLVVIVFYLDM